MLKFNRMYNGTEIIFTLLCPIIAIPILLYGIYKQRYKDLILLAICMAIIAMSIPPFFDLYHHTLDYIQYTKTNDPSWIQTKGHDYILYTISYAFAKLNIPFEFVRGLFTFFCYMVSFSLFKRIILSKDYFSKSKKTIFFVFLCFYLSVPFIWIINGLRLGTAVYILVISWLYIYDKKYIYGIILYITAILMHFGSSLFFPVLLFTIIPIKLNKVTYISIFILLFILGHYIIRNIPDDILIYFAGEHKMDLYINNSQEAFSNRLSLNGLIAMYLERATLIYLFFYCIGNRLTNTNEIYLIRILLLVAIIYHPFVILFQKFCLMIIPITIYLFMLDIKNISIVKVKQLTICCVVSVLAYIYGYFEHISKIDFMKLLLPLFYTIFTFDTIETMKKTLINK